MTISDKTLTFIIFFPAILSGLITLCGAAGLIICAIMGWKVGD